MEWVEAWDEEALAAEAAEAEEAAEGDRSEVEKKVSAQRLNTQVILRQLKKHAPFTIIGALSGIALMLGLRLGHVPQATSTKLFWAFHPAYVLLSALATAAMYRLHSSGKLLRTIIIGLVGSLGIATLSDSIIPFVGEWLLQMPHRGVHIGFIEKWWLVNPLAFAGIALAWFWPKTVIPHAGHVFLSSWASLFHITMALGDNLSTGAMLAIFIFLFLAVWIPCCTSDIVFPLLFAEAKADR